MKLPKIEKIIVDNQVCIIIGYGGKAFSENIINKGYQGKLWRLSKTLVWEPNHSGKSENFIYAILEKHFIEFNI